MIAPLFDLLPDMMIGPIVRAALAEDLGRAGDITSAACIDADARMSGVFRARKSGIIAGLACVRLALAEMDSGGRFEAVAADGDHVAPDAVLARVEANARALLSAERTALNLIGHLSGIATLTGAYVAQVTGTRARVIDTRKTTPGLRAIEKYATRMGGAVNHRMGLYDAVLIKDTHLALVGGITPALRAARKAYPEMEIHVEVSNLQELEQALADKASHILLDNFSCGQVREAMQLIRGRATVEVSGGVQVTNARAYALAGADFISVGALTHSAVALDFSMKVTRY